ncbi:DUF4240 domain-containing protein [Dactylosporangium sp. NPDC000521]|uniref:DUF4240 domain-containing protein n=1 Tax=Dactylosporangium sp. NPDC000521 TaxID=3363975 RepID=UPI0036B8202F
MSGGAGIRDVWQLVDEARADLGGAPPADDVAATMVRLLSGRPPAAIAALDRPFDELMAMSYRADLWAAAYIINGGASNDGFDYFRGWLVAQGREWFECALAGPDSLAAHPEVIAAAAEAGDLDGEPILYVVMDAYRAATDEDDVPAYSDTVWIPDLDPDWSFDYNNRTEMRRRLPALVALFDGEEKP